MLKHPIIGQIGERKENTRIWFDIVDAMSGDTLHRWAPLELQRYFGIEGSLNGGNAMEIFEKCFIIVYRGGHSKKLPAL